MNHKIEILGTKQVRHQLHNQTRAIMKWDVATVRFPIASVRRLKMQGNTVVFKEEQSYTEDRSGKRTESAVQGNVYWLRAKVLKGEVDGKLVCAVADVEMRALEDRSERFGPLTSSSSTEPMNIREELVHAETRGPEVRVRLSNPGNPIKS